MQQSEQINEQIQAIATDEINDPTLLPLRPLSHHLALCIYWLGNSLMWGALLHLGMQSRLRLWFAEDEVGHYLGVLGAVGGIIGAVTQLLAGAASDRSMHPWGRRRPFILAGSLLAGVALLFLGKSEAFWFMLLALAGVQLASNSALSPFTALLPDTVNPREHGKASGFMGLARLLGDIGGMILGTFLLSVAVVQGGSKAQIAAYQNERWFILCAIMAGFLVLGAVLTCVIIREVPLRQRSDRTALQAAADAFHISLWKYPDFAWLTFSRAVTNFGFYIFLGVFLFYTTYSLKAADPETMARNLTLPAIIIAGLVSIPAGILSDRIGRKRLIYFSQFMLAGAAVMYMLAPDARLAFWAAIPAGIAYGVFSAVEWALACNLLPKQEFAKYLAVWNASAVVPQVLAFPVGGSIGSMLAHWGEGLGWRVDFGITVICCIVGAILLVHIKEPRFSEDENTNPAS